ncbi:ATP-dependent DNA helicase DinG [Halobacillus litoralis]|uniref:ATP-dependent DNA helicase DinG n=1 Tax=Halobacillus litoralis TaxID=45668 RepID=UPI001CD510DD|nr:ATP-dependent DNA helicase DinG [Halobacillus litoralis]MCA0970375.1 ATP-dependent DNA helicase DinG [Halobacillus litoralis]
MTTFAIVDLETTGNASSKGDRMIEIGIVLMKEDGTVLKEFSSLVYPEREIPPFISSLTGIEDDDVLDAPLFSEIVEEVYSMVKNSCIVAHNIEFDLGFLNHELNQAGYPSLHTQIMDTVELSRILLPMSPSFKLGHLSEYLGMGHDRPHRALSDAQATSDLLVYLLKRLHELPERTLEYLLRIEPKLKSGLRPFIQAGIEAKRYQSTPSSQDYELWHGIPVKKVDRSQIDVPDHLSPFSEWLDGVYDSEDGLSSVMDRYEMRKGQKEMSEDTYHALMEERHALIEAGAGTGKSIAYLLSAIFASMKKKERILITTHTTALQKQLLEEEIPRIEKLFPRPVQAVLYKGKSHYISLVHFRYELDQSDRDNYDISLTKATILVWLTETTTGDVDEIQLPSNGRQFWHKVSSEQSTKVVHLDGGEASFYDWARKKAEGSDIMITNHALFSLDLISDEERLPTYDRVIIDEAHHLEAVTTRYFGVQFNYRDLQRQLSQLSELYQRPAYARFSLPEEFYKEAAACQKLVDQAKEELNQWSRYMFQQLKRTHRRKRNAKSDIGRIQYSLSASDPLFQNAKEMCFRFLSEIRTLAYRMERMHNHLALTTKLMDDPSLQVLLSRLESRIEFCRQTIKRLDQYFSGSDEMAKWIEIEGGGASNAVYLFSEPLDVTGTLQKKLFEQKKSVILTSATLSTNQSFTYIKKTLGLQGDDRLLEKTISSPYDFDQQVRLMIPSDFPNIKEQPEEYIDALSEAIYSMAYVTKGRMLVLFTSYDMLRKTYELLKEFIDPEEFMIFAQGITSGSRDRLKKNFQSFDQAILLGTSSFWEGVDIPGDDLSCLVMVRLPFQPPEQPLQSMQNQHLKEEGKNPFMERSLPHAILRFKQGFGRLIRSATDRGVVFVCDQRIMEARYGKYFISSIPKVPISYKSTRELMNEMEDWI